MTSKYLDRFLRLFDELDKFELWHSQDDWSLEFRGEMEVRLLKNGQPVEDYNTHNFCLQVIASELGRAPF